MVCCVVESELLSINFAAAAAKSLQSCPTLCDPHRWQPTRLLRPWDFPGKNTGVECHCHVAKLKSTGEFPGSPVVRTPSFHTGAMGSISSHCHVTKLKSTGEFPGSPVVRTPSFHKGAMGSISSWGLRVPMQRGLDNKYNLLYIKKIKLFALHWKWIFYPYMILQHHALVIWKTLIH